jgi:RNA polymerase sigma-70 factor (sigma-E family)
VTFEEFAASRLRGLLGTAVALCGDVGLAEDLVQDVLIKAQSNWGRVERTANPDAYLRRMLVNEHLSWRRKWARLIPTRDMHGVALTGDHASQLADRDLLRTQILRLPRQQQAVLALRYYGGLSDEEIAETMRCRPSTVRAYASRALATIRAELKSPTNDVEERTT